MRKTIAIAILLLMLPALSLADARTEKTKSDLLQIEVGIGMANLHCDYTYFKAIEAEEFIFTDSSGQVTTRAQDLAGEKDCKKQQGKFALSDSRVMVFDDTAVVSAIGTYDITNAAGVAVTRRNRFTDVFVKRKGAWALVAGHSSALKTPAN